MPHLYLTSFARITNDDLGTYWGPPSPHAVGCIDVRSLPECGQLTTEVPRSLFSLSARDNIVDIVMTRADPVTSLLIVGLFLYVRALSGALRDHMQREEERQQEFEQWRIEHITDHAKSESTT